MSTYSQPLNEQLQLKSTQNSLSSKTFTMVFLDFDDTLFPSRLYHLFARNLAIDILQLFSNSDLLKLQNIIVESIESIMTQYKKSKQHIEFCVVSNASQKWLDNMLKTSAVHCKTCRLTVLGQYLEENGVSIVSASSKAYEYVKKQFGDNAEDVFGLTMLPENKENTFMWKYTAFSSVISALTRKTAKTCGRIISIGDGNDEEKALKEYANTHRIKSLHIRLLNGATIHQLMNEWIYLKYNLSDRIKDTVNSLFYVDDISDIYPSIPDNNKYCTGKTHQLPAIKQYFELWMDNMMSRLSGRQQKMATENVCQCIHKRLYSLKPGCRSSRNLKLILITAICKHYEFNRCFNAYYARIQRYSYGLQKSIK